MARVIIFPVINDQRPSIQLATQILSQGSTNVCTVCSKIESVRLATLPLRINAKTALHGRFRRLSDLSCTQVWNHQATDHQALFPNPDLERWWEMFWGAVWCVCVCFLWGGRGG